MATVGPGTTQQSGQTPDNDVEIKNITVYVSFYPETDTTGGRKHSSHVCFSVAADINSFGFYFSLPYLKSVLTVVLRRLSPHCSRSHTPRDYLDQQVLCISLLQFEYRVRQGMAGV